MITDVVDRVAPDSSATRHRMISRVAVALGRGLLSQLHPMMLALLLVPLIGAVTVWALSAWYFWQPLTAWLRLTWFTGDGWLARACAWAASVGLVGLDHWISNLLAFLLTFPLVIVSALGLIAVLAMPMVVRFVGVRHYRDVEARGSLGVLAGVGNLAKTLLVFIPGYLLTTPLWLIPPLALIVPWLWWGWFTARLLSFDSSVEYASADERKRLLRRERGSYLVLALACTALNYIPPLFLVAPVLSALVFAHYSLARLRELRMLPLRVNDQEKIA